MRSRFSSPRLFASFRTSVLVTLSLSSITAHTLSSIAQATRTDSAQQPEPSRVDIYGGYGYIHPVNSDINNYKYQPITPGVVASVTRYFNNYLGLQAEGSIFLSGPNDCVFTAQAGPIVRYQRGHFVPFIHVLGGGAKVGGPVYQTCTWGWGVTAGSGVDYILPIFHNHFALRLVQANFDYSHVDYGPLVLPAGTSGGLGEIFAYRLSAGVVLRFGQITPPPPVQLSCLVQPDGLFPGDPITILANASNLDPKKKPIYTWTSTGGQISGNNASATISSVGLGASDYTVSAHVSQGRKPNQQASCTAAFHIRAYEPPTISCSAAPSNVMPGETATITSIGLSPQNRPLTYSYSASAGQVSSTANTAILSTSGVSPGTISVVCNVVDDVGHQATAASSVTVVSPPAPPVPPTPQTRNLCELSFERDKRRPVRVDNEAKACLDDVALALNRDSSAKLVIIAQHSTDEPSGAAAERALNVEQYLTLEKGVDSSRIELRIGGSTGRTVRSILVPVGASFDPSGTAPIDSSSITRRGAS